jgi:hypothetical protein
MTGPEAGGDAVVPDRKSWTWVLDRPCPDCGVDTRSVAGPEVAGMVPGILERWHAVLLRDDVRIRPEPGTWSPLEYACHVRDAFRVFAERFRLMAEHDDPAFPDWDQDETARTSGYRRQDPVEVARELTAAAAALQGRLSAVAGDQWQRRGYRSDGSAFTVDTLARYFVHDPLHHLHDVRD